MAPNGADLVIDVSR